MICKDLGERDKQREKGIRRSKVRGKCLVLKFIRGALLM